ncbi:acyltransferase domain-containing protein, partial [Mycobacterium simulans]|uniref:acyltransferase domain-containing protein n=1 Tax=Mycobacterium simulans TaxID=627089 RepID=UPI0017496BD2
KMVLALNHDILPPTLHVDEPSPHIDWSAGGVRLLTEPVPWPQSGHPRTAGVSSFGISGTNAHVILQQAPEPAAPAPEAAPLPDAASLLHVWPVSARTPAALCAQAQRLGEYLGGHPGVDVADVGFSLATTRAQHPYRAVITAGGAGEDVRERLVAGLGALAAGRSAVGVVQHHLSGQAASSVVFVLPGQGAQYAGMGVQLYRQHRVFADAVDEVCAALDGYLPVPLGQVMFADPDSEAAGLLTQTAYTQPALFAFGVGMAAVLADAGIGPDVLVGHSVGELTAAYLAGVFSLADAAGLVAQRGRLMQACPVGAMLAISAAEAEVVGLLQGFAGVGIAAVNGPSSVVVSGEVDQITAVQAQCGAAGLVVTRLRVSHGFHSALMDAALPEFAAVAARVRFSAPAVPVVSNLTGQIATAEQLCSPDYWVRQLRESVRFGEGITALLAERERVFVELSPHPVLAAAISDTVAGVEGGSLSVVIPTLHREHP